MEPDRLLACAAACGLFARLFRPGLEPGLLARLGADGLAGAWPLPPRSPEGQAALDLFARALSPLNEPAIETDNSLLFIGPESPVPTWESVWTTNERLLFAPCEAEVRALYAAAGFVLPQPNNPADDLSLELAFLAALLSRGEQDQAGTFLSTHLARWAPACLAQIASEAQTDFYRATAALAAETLASMSGL